MRWEQYCQNLSVVFSPLITVSPRYHSRSLSQNSSFPSSPRKPLILSITSPSRFSVGLPSQDIRSDYRFLPGSSCSKFEKAFLFEGYPLISYNGRLRQHQYKVERGNPRELNRISIYSQITLALIATLIQPWRFPSPTTLRRNLPLSRRSSQMRTPSWVMCNQGMTDT